MNFVIRTDDVAPPDRFAYWQDLISRLPVPLEIHSDRAADFRAELYAADLGSIQVLSAAFTPHEVRRPPRLIRPSDPGMYGLLLSTHGRGEVIQDQRQVSFERADLVLVDTSRPFRGVMAGDHHMTRVVMVLFPHALLPLRSHAVGQLTAVRLQGHQGVGTLVAHYLACLGRHVAACLPVDGRLSTATLDLVAAMLTEELDGSGSGAPERHRQVGLLPQIHSFIQERLGEPDLSPDTVAAAHHISTRYLHKLFHEQGTTVARWIRDRRLERCRRDLADPALASSSIGAIAARWGFPDGAHFSRLFRSVHGISPKDYRRNCRETAGSM